MNILNYIQKLLDRLSSSGTLEVDRNQSADDLSKENTPSPPPKDSLILDSYVKSAPHPQNALDIFQGEWSSKLPKPLEDTQAGAALLFDDPRLKWFINEIGGVHGKSVLELGPLEGGHTYLLEKLGAESITAIEANTRSFLKCLVVKELLQLQKSHFLCGDFVEYLGQPGTNFEVCIASGVLYHMQNPVELIARLANRCTQYIFLWTHYYDREIITTNPNLAHKFGEVIQREYQGFQHQLYRQEYKSALGWSGFCGGSAPISHWMTREDILNCLRHFGFNDIRINYDQPHHPNGPSFAVTAIRSAKNIDSEAQFKAIRKQVSDTYLSGNGIEIGALHSPLEIPAHAQVRYVDRLSVADLRKQYPELADSPLVEVDIIDNGELLLSIADASVDFVIANHMIEHCQNPIATIENHLRVLKAGGILYMAVPDKRYTFDIDRPVTSLEHLINDYHQGPEISKLDHFTEWVKLVNKAPENKIQEQVKHLIEIDYSIHFHVWTQVEFWEFLLYCKQTLKLDFEVELLQRNGMEFIVVMRKIS